MYVTQRMRVLCLQIHKKIKIGIPIIGTFPLYLPSMGNLKLKFLAYNENKYGLSFDIKIYTTSG